MQYFVLTLIVIAVALSNIFRQKYDKACHGGAFFFTFVVSLFAMAVFLAVNREWSYRAELLQLSVGFVAAYVSANILAVPAVLCGVATGLTNCFVTRINFRLPAFVMFPVIAGDLSSTSEECRS
ncbi:MAG: hypothetical protein ACI3XQ_02420 [Eubacteriales bacterium]